MDGVIKLHNPNNVALYNIYGLDRAPDYFKIVVYENQFQYFVPGNWEVFNNTGHDYWPNDGFPIGCWGQGGEISFWREVAPGGLYHTGRLLCYSGVADYFAD